MESSFSIKINETVYKMCKEKLSNESGYFKSLFNSNMIELSNNQVDLSVSMSNQTFGLVVNFIEDCSPVHLSRSNVDEVLSVAEYLQIDRLKNFCSVFVGEQLEIRPTVDLLELVTCYSMHNIRDKYLSSVHDNFRLLSMESKYSLNAARIIFTNSNVISICKLLGSDRLRNLTSEMDIYEACNIWLNNHDRKQYESRIYNCVRVALIRPSILLEIINNHKDHTDTWYNRCKDALSYHKMNWPRKFLDNDDARIRNTSPTYCDFDNSTLIIAPPEKDTPIRLNSASFSVINAIVTIDDFIYIECFDFQVMTCSIWRFDPRHYFFHYLKSPPIHNISTTLASTGRDGGFYLIGGKNPTDMTCQSTVLYYDATLNSWKVFKNMPVNISDSAAVVDLENGDLYVIGGKSSGEITNYMFRYRNDEWKQLTDMLNVRKNHTAIILDKNIYIIGGKDCAIEKYSINENKWYKLEGSTTRNVNFSNSKLISYNNTENRLQFTDNRYMYTIDLTDDLPIEIREHECNIIDRLIICKSPSYSDTISTDEDIQILNKLCEHYFILLYKNN